MSIDFSGLQVDSRDYVSIYNDLVSSIPDVSQIWNSTDENDPGIVLVKLMAMYGDMLSYNHDMAVLEVYPESVKQRKNASQIFRLIGYKMRWYRSARCTAYISNTSDYSVTMPEYTRFSTKDGDIYYTYISSDATKNPIINSNMSNTGSSLEVELIQGYPRTPPLLGSDLVPPTSEEWHYVYDYNISKSDIILGNRFYVQDSAIEESSITLIDDSGDTWIQVDNIDSLTESGKYYELRIDEYDRPYIELISYWENLKVGKFKLFYVVSAGANGQITDNAIYRADSRIIAIIGSTTQPYQTDVSNYISITNKASTYGYNPETADEARIESAKYINTYDTLVTLADFERAVKRLEGVANCVATDKTNDPKETEDYVGSGDGHLTRFECSLSRNDVIIFEPTDTENPTHNAIRIVIYKHTKTSDGIVTSEFAWTTEDSLTTGELYGGDGFDNGSITVIDKSVLIEINTISTFSSNVYFTVKYFSNMSNTDLRIYVTKTDDYNSNISDNSFSEFILDSLSSKKLMPLDIAIDLSNINYYEWTFGGTIYLKEKVSLDKAQDIIVNINNELKYRYSKTKIGYNSIIGYSDLINIIMDTDSLIRNIDIDPIEYYDVIYDNGGNEIVSTEVSKDLVSGKFRENNWYDFDSSNIYFRIQLSNVPVKPGTVSIRIIDGRCIITDDKNGGLTSNSSVLNQGIINYNNGIIDVYLTGIDSSYISNNKINASINYSMNAINMAIFRGINTEKLVISDECIKDIYY